MSEDSWVWAGRELDRICGVIKKNMDRYGTDFPSACATNGRYRIKKNDDWTNGFWTGMLWMAYLYTGDGSYKELAMKNVESFGERLKEHFVLDHHDIGFLYSPSAAAAWRVTGDDRLKDMITDAADVLAGRFQERGGFIQAWGKMGAEKEYRLIIDSLLNLPLLYTAAEITGNERYREIAGRHYRNVVDCIVREDGSTYHTYYFDKATGAPAYGATHQGYSDYSCWARGQAWAVYGIPLHARVSGEALTQAERETYHRIVEYFETHLPADGMPYWDLVFTDRDNQPRDSSALAIAACGMMETGNLKRAEEMLKTCRDMASSEYEPDNEGLLLHGVYAYSEGKGVDEPNLWGDFFYMEGLLRLLRRDWIPFL